MSVKTNTKPLRPLGLSLAIGLCVLLFVVFPLIRLGFDWTLQSRLSGLSGPLTLTQDQTIAPLAVGGALDLITVERLAIDGGSALVVFAICVMAWRGRPAWSRYALSGAVSLMAFLAALSTLNLIGQAPSVVSGVTSADGAITSLRWTQLALTVLVPLYVVWYINRAPARAFYRQSVNQTEPPAPLD